MTNAATTTERDLDPPRDLAADFSPPAWLANAHLQSVLPSLKLRKPLMVRRARELLLATQDQIVDCGDGVRLLGHYSSQTAVGRAPAKDLVILLHGWEGHADSHYVLSLGQHLFTLGCDIFRLNFRDHGPTHHLNQDIFHSCRLPEVVGAVSAIQQKFPDQRLSIAGFSLGGNFALRVAATAPTAGIRLERAVAVSPVLHPNTTLLALEAGPFLYRQYFIGKWKRSLRIKQQLFPQTFDFRSILATNSIRVMTERLVERHTEYGSLEDYLNGYAIVGEVLAKLAIPSYLLAAADDPIIPASDLVHLAQNPCLTVTRVASGGHCGFMDHWNAPSWADRRVARLMGLTRD